MIKDVIIHYGQQGLEIGKSVVEVSFRRAGAVEVVRPCPDAARRFLEFFTANIKNPNTRRAYARADVEFALWCERNGFRELQDIGPFPATPYRDSSNPAGRRRQLSSFGSHSHAASNLRAISQPLRGRSDLAAKP
jgi:hypothetical protein